MELQIFSHDGTGLVLEYAFPRKVLQHKNPQRCKLVKLTNSLGGKSSLEKNPWVVNPSKKQSIKSQWAVSQQMQCTLYIIEILSNNTTFRMKMQ